MPSDIMKIGPDGKLDREWKVTWRRTDRQPMLGTATHVREIDGIKKYLVRFKHGQHWVKETQLEF